MSPDLISRLVGTIIFGLVGGRLGADIALQMALPPEISVQLFALVGVLVGLILTPWLTVRPFRIISEAITEMPVETLFMALTGMVAGLAGGLLVSYPLSLIPSLAGDWLPVLTSLTAGYLGMTIFKIRAKEMWLWLRQSFVKGNLNNEGGDHLTLLDTSVLIDGRIVEIAKTGFIGGTLLVPRFVINELHQVADSQDPMRRSRGKFGLDNLNELQRTSSIPLKITEDDEPNIIEVDDKLVAVAVKMQASLLTNDFPLNRVAGVNNLRVLNVNALANAVRAQYLPGETFPIRIIQEGRENNQGVGYLRDGTMVVVEEGKSYMDRTVNVMVTRFINRDTGRMYFAVPQNG